MTKTPRSLFFKGFILAETVGFEPTIYSSRVDYKNPKSLISWAFQKSPLAVVLPEKYKSHTKNHTLGPSSEGLFYLASFNRSKVKFMILDALSISPLTSCL